MHPILHALNIGTLALWLSVTAFGTAGTFLSHPTPEKSRPKKEDPVLISEEIIIGGEPSSPAAAAEAQAENSGIPPQELPTPPEIPALPDFQPLPEIPSTPTPRPADFAIPTPPAPSPTTRTNTPNALSSKPRATANANANANTAPGSTGTGTGTGTSTGTGGSGDSASNSARLEAGRMPPPLYPAYSRRNNQTGVVIVEFTVDASGSVISAFAKSSSNWPLLDNEAVRAVRRWKFAPGSIMKLQRPIIFKLN